METDKMASLTQSSLGISGVLQPPPSTHQAPDNIQASTSNSSSSHTMSGVSKNAYAASCNPARRVKQHRIDAPQKPNSAPHLPQEIMPILPKRPQVDIPPDSTAATLHTPAKRGRKPGPLSRTARETQRKLNHSIIEKARRTRINEALATLRQLVPVDYGYPNDDKSESDEDHDRQQKKEKKVKGAGKREKEREFKLEILIRTVSFMQDLLERVKLLEAEEQRCLKCDERESSKKRKRDSASDEADYRDDQVSKRSDRREANVRDEMDTAVSTVQSSTSNKLFVSRPYLGSRLPSISSWLPAQADPISLPPPQQLPSPPSSARFEPAQSPHTPPTLNLGPVAISSLLSPVRTPEDESAASLLLQISTSPPLLPGMGLGSSASFDLSRMRTGCATPVKSQVGEIVHAQTPAMMLGITRPKKD